MTHVEDAAASSSAQVEEEERSRVQACPVLTLPGHLLREVLGLLGAADVARAATTCPAFRAASRCEILWRRLLAAKLGAQAGAYTRTR
jgi:hypothetical protein